MNQQTKQMVKTLLRYMSNDLKDKPTSVYGKAKFPLRVQKEPLSGGHNT